VDFQTPRLNHYDFENDIEIISKWMGKEKYDSLGLERERVSQDEQCYRVDVVCYSIVKWVHAVGD
jgi:hypothetical protein